MKQFLVRFLGTACARPTVSRYCSSIALMVNDAVYVLDCGEPCAASLIRAGINLAFLQSVFVTHVHTDHVSGLPSLLDATVPYNRTEPVNVFLPSYALPRIADYLDLVGSDGLHRLHPIQPGMVYEDAHIRLDAYPTRHTRESYAFTIEANGKRLVYSGDITSPEEVASLYDNADLGIIELAHFPPSAIAQHLKGRPIGRLVMTHLSYRLQGVDSECAIVAQLQKELISIPIEMAKDGMAISI